jgi:hypothetical protein
VEELPMKVNVSLLVGACLLSLVSAPQAQTANDAINKSLDLFRKMAQPQQKPAMPGGSKESSQTTSESSQGSESSEQAQQRTAVDPDIVGLRLGMAGKDADDELKRRYANTKQAVFKVDVQGPPKVNYVAAFGAIRGTPPDSEYVGVYLAPPPNDRSVLGIYRQLLYPAAKAPNRAELVQALESKYGRPGSRVESGGATTYLWHFDRPAGGKCAGGSRPGLVLHTLVGLPRYAAVQDFDGGASYWSSLVRFGQPIEQCGRVLEAIVGTDQSKQLVTGLTLFLSDGTTVAKAYSATKAWSAGAQSAAQQERVNASKGKSPSL